MAYEYSRLIANTQIGGFLDAGANTNTPGIGVTVADYIYATSGDCLIVKFVAPVGQTAGTLTVHVYCDVLTGSPTFQMEVYDSFDGTNGTIDRPDSNGSVLSSAPNTVTPSASGKWCSFTATVTLTQGASYFCLIKNTHASHTANYATFRVRGGCDALAGGFTATTTYHGFSVGYSTDGTATAPTYNTSGVSCAVVSFADGTIIGNPYAVTNTHASNTNSRGNSFTPTEDMVVSGLQFAVASTAISGAGIYTTGGATVASTTGDYHSRGKASTFRFAPVTLTGGTQYLFLVNFGSASTIGNIGYMGDTTGNLPADVLACRQLGGGYWDGTTAQRDAGTGTIDTTSIINVVALLDESPAISGAAGGLVRNSPMLGGMI